MYMNTKSNYSYCKMEMNAFNIHTLENTYEFASRSKSNCFGFRCCFRILNRVNVGHFWWCTAILLQRNAHWNESDKRMCISSVGEWKKETNKKSYRHLLNVECSCVHEITICQFPYCRCEFIVFSLCIGIVDNIDVAPGFMENIHCRQSIQREIEFIDEFCPQIMAKFILSCLCIESCRSHNKQIYTIKMSSNRQRNGNSTNFWYVQRIKMNQRKKNSHNSKEREKKNKTDGKKVTWTLLSCPGKRFSSLGFN